MSKQLVAKIEKMIDLIDHFEEKEQKQDAENNGALPFDVTDRKWIVTGISFRNGDITLSDRSSDLLDSVATYY